MDGFNPFLLKKDFLKKCKKPEMMNAGHGPELVINLQTEIIYKAI